MSLSSSAVPTLSRPVSHLSRLLRDTEPAGLVPLLRAGGFVAAPDSELGYTAGPADVRPDRDGAVAHLDPRRPRSDATLAGARMGMYVSDCYLNTEAEPPYLRLPSFGDHNPYLIAYLLGFPPGETRSALVDLQVFSTGGTIRLTATGNPTGVTVGFTSFPVAVPISLTTTAEGFASIFVQRIGETGFDWHAVDVF
jgi:hypothetical protein